jgi:hypothetical protein
MCADLLKRVRASESVGVCVQIHTANGKNNTTQQMIQQHPEQLCVLEYWASWWDVEGSVPHLGYC